jgi:hypothetical protein
MLSTWDILLINRRLLWKQEVRERGCQPAGGCL